MDKKPLLNTKSLKEQVYDFLRVQMERGELLPGSAIDMEETSRRLGVSKTPLRDALLQLESEGFVTILPRRKILVNGLTIDDIRNYYEIIGALESMALHSAFDRIGLAEVERMDRLNAEMDEAIAKDDFDLYYAKNLLFHDVFLRLSHNETLIRTVTNLKRRLYDFPRRQGFVKEWEQGSIGEHARLVDLIRSRDREGASAQIRDVHWSFEVQEPFIARYYTKAAALAE
jgi:DNA-binding GntR family transcriptional regulator